MQEIAKQHGTFMDLIWDENLSVGNATIDSDHKNLIVVVNRLANAIRSRNRDELTTAFELLDIYMDIHFRNEERIASAVKLSFEKHKVDHRQLMHELRYMIKKLEAIDSDWPDNLANKYCHFLHRWLTGHIINSDMQMKPVLANYPYDFKPGYCREITTQRRVEQ